MDIVNKMLGKTIYFYYFNTVDGSASTMEAYNLYSFKEHKVVFETEKDVILDDDTLSKISKVDIGYGITLEKPIIHLRIADNYWGNTIDLLLYSEKLIGTDELKMLIMDKIARVCNSASDINLEGLNDVKMELKGEY